MDQSRDYLKQHVITICKPSEIKEVIKCFHITHDGRHIGINKTMDKIQEFYYFDKTLSNIQKYIKSCKFCKTLKRKKKNKHKILDPSDLRHRIKSVVGYANTSELNDKLRRLNLNMK